MKPGLHLLVLMEYIHHFPLNDKDKKSNIYYADFLIIVLKLDYICGYFASSIRIFLIEKRPVLLYTQDKNRPIKYIILEFNAH
jgi:hypothetical protein